MKTLTKQELQSVLALHSKWLNSEECGEYADLRYADLEGAVLEGANLRGADLYGVNLEGARYS